MLLASHGFYSWWAFTAGLHTISMTWALELNSTLCAEPISLNPMPPHACAAVLISNDKFKSVTHRVLANQVGPRISVACFFGPQQLGNRLYGPVKELLSDDNPPLYREILVREYLAHYASKGISKSALAHFRL
ncbi:1-aminocyclopropane-1-carboxylate oxidase like 1 [Fagus crenata]